MTLTLRIGLAVLALMELALGLWTSLAPESFYNDVPTVDLTPPYSEHLLRDFGGATLGLAVVLGAAAIWPGTRLVIIALLAYLAFSAPHLAFHVGHLHGVPDIQATVLTIGLSAMVALPVALLGVAIARLRAERRARAAGHSQTAPSLSE